MKKNLLLFLFIFSFLTPCIGQTQSREGLIQFSVGPGIGFNTPTRFDLDAAAEYFYDDTFSLGLDFDIFVRGDGFFDLLPFVRYHFDLLEQPKFLPYVGGGAGILFGSNGNVAFDLMAPNLGFEYEVTPHLFVGPDASFHILMGDRFWGGSTRWDLQIVGRVGYRF